MKLTFKGGVHPPEFKEITENCAVNTPALPKEVDMLMSQHIGAICVPTVKKKQHIEVGEVIGDSEAFVSAKVHSSVSGTVKDIALRSHPVLGRVQAVVIDTDEDCQAKQPADQDIFEKLDIEKISPETILKSITDSGIVGMGGAGFPTSVKTIPNPKQPKDILIINACECEPYITCDYRVMLEWTEQFIAGVRLLKKASGCKDCIIAIEDNKPQASKLIAEKVVKYEGIRVAVVMTKYPQGGERQLINSVLGKVMPTGKIPPMEGIVVCNVSTVAAIAQAVATQSPLTHRIVTVSGKGIQNPGNYYLPIGIKVEDILEIAGGLKENTVKIVLGGPMMGFAIGDLATPTTKTTGSVLALTKEEIGKTKLLAKETPCIRCGRCLDVCPEKLNPTKIAHAVKANRLDSAMQNYISACMECGSCSYVCPANIPLTGYIKTGKILIARKNKNMPA